MNQLPDIMVAPNGARRSKADHPQLPVTIPEIVNTAQACWQAGAGGIHLHVRDRHGEHVLDAGLYREATDELLRVVPELFVQITTEAVGRYTPKEQRQVVKHVLPQSVSVSIAEMHSDNDALAALDFYRWCDDNAVIVQHILYNTNDLVSLQNLLKHCTPKATPLHLLFVLGRYSKNQQSQLDDLLPFTDWLQERRLQTDWASCAFGQNETNCLLATYKVGGKVRVGFENSLWNSNGELATDNAERVAEIRRVINSYNNEKNYCNSSV